MRKIILLLMLQVSICFAETGGAVIPPDSIYQVKSRWVDQFGQQVGLDSLAGKPVAVSMVYLSCHFACPTTIAHMKALRELLPDAMKNEVQFVLISFDGKNDTPAAMKKYAEKHRLSYPEWRFMTSRDDADVREFAALIDFKYKKVGKRDYEHSFGIVVLDAAGRILGSTVGTAMQEKDLVPLLVTGNRGDTK